MKIGDVKVGDIVRPDDWHGRMSAWDGDDWKMSLPCRHGAKWGHECLRCLIKTVKKAYGIVREVRVPYGKIRDGVTVEMVYTGHDETRTIQITELHTVRARYLELISRGSDALEVPA